MSKKYWTGLVLLIALGVSLLCWQKFWNNTDVQKEKIHFRYYKFPELQIKLYGKDSQYVILAPKKEGEEVNVMVSNNYVAGRETNLRDDEQADHKVFEEGEYYYLHLYDINNHFQAQKIDIGEILSNNQLGGQIFWKLLTYQNRDYILLSISKDRKFIHKLLDIKTKQLSDAPKEILHGDNLKDDEQYLEVSSETDLFNVLKQNNKIYEGMIYHTFYIEAYAKSKPELEDSKLLQEEPELAKALQNGGVLFTRSEMVDAKTWFNTILHWFAPKGQDVLEVYVTAEDGTKTQIKSYDEFVEWRKTHPRTN